MSTSELGPWEPLEVAAVVDVFGTAPLRWWISGGRALELHVGRSWRDHDDTDIGIIRRDVVVLGSVLDGWDIHIAAAGQLTPWTGEGLETALHQNNLWCRHHADGPWMLDVTIGEGDDEAWIYRRDPTVRIPWAEAILRTPDGIPYLSSDLQLLFKSKNPRNKDHVDAHEVVPELDAKRRQRLTRLLAADHPWQRLLVNPP